MAIQFRVESLVISTSPPNYLLKFSHSAPAGDGKVWHTDFAAELNPTLRRATIDFILSGPPGGIMLDEYLLPIKKPGPAISAETGPT